MKAIRLANPWEVSCVELPMPEPKAGEALIKVKAVGICGSDIGAFRGTNSLVSYPRILGHEIAGEIVSIPPNEKGLQAGDRVVVDPYMYCGTFAILVPLDVPIAVLICRCWVSMLMVAWLSISAILHPCL